MLTSFRKQKKLLKFFLWVVIISFIGTIFLVWGVGNRQKETNYAIKVNDTKITYQEYKEAYERTSKTIKQLFGGQALPKSIDIGGQVRQQLISRYLLLQKAKEMGISVSDVEVLAEIMKIPSFYVNGQFDKQRYQEILKLNRIDPQAFEASIKQQILLSKVSNLIRSSVNVSDKEIENEYKYRNTEASISYIELKAKDFLAQVKVDNAELTKFYNENRENYRVPEKIKVKYIVFDPNNYNDNVTVSQEEIEAYYIKNKAMFDTPETVEARHIITRVSNWNDNASVSRAKAKIEEVLAQIEKGKDFAELAKKYSEGPTAKNGGYLGTFSKGDMVKEFEDVAFKLKDGAISGIVKSEYGFHIIKVIKHNPAKSLTLDEAKEQIIKDIKKEKEKTAFRNYVLKTYKQILDASNITGYVAENHKLKVYKSNYFAMGDPNSPLKDNIKGMKSIFRLEPTEVSNIITIGNKQYIFEVMDKKPSYIPELDKIKPEVTKDYKEYKASKLAYAKAEEILKLKDFKKISSTLKKSFITTQLFKRIEPIPQIGPNSDLTAQIFSTKPGDLLAKPYKQNTSSFIIKVNKIVKPDLKNIDDQKAQIKSYLLNIKQQEAYSDFIKKLIKSAKIEINPRIIEEK
jgi:peptidyl-prolyl cis-trans isomerase D